MANSETKSQYEGAILNQLTKNAERIAVVEKDIGDVKQELHEVKRLAKTAINLLTTVLIGIVINIFSQPILTSLF